MKLSKKTSEDLNYLNMQEIQKICVRHKIPYKSYFEKDKNLKKSSEKDRKGVVLARIRHFLSTGKIKEPTIFHSKVVCFDPLPRDLKEDDKMFYGQYKNKSPKILALLKKLTDKQFKYGALSQETIRDFWTRGTAPSHRQFAKAWLKAKKDHDKPNPEWAYLMDLSKGLNVKDWKKLRQEKADKLLEKIGI